MQVKMTIRFYAAIIALGVALAVAALGLSYTVGRKATKTEKRASTNAKKEATNFYRAGEYDRTIDKLSDYLKENPGDYEAQVLLTSAYIVTGKTAKAYKEAKKAYSMKKSPDVGYQLAILADKLGEDTEAISYLKAAIKVRPGSIPFHTQLADFYFKYKKYDEAIAEWNAVLKLLPPDSPARAEVYAKLASAYDATGKADKASEARAAAKRAQPSAPINQ